ncbi:MAG: hypothetical protein WCH13_09390, partial [Deltaproteobacteria bacterium]
MRDRSRAFAPSRIVRACALAFLAVLAAAPNASARESGFQSEGAYALVSKDINGARWAMTYDTQSEVITGNVFPTDGGPPKFVVCDVLSVDAQGALAAACSGADACISCPCSAGWAGLGTVNLPGSFFEICGGGSQPTEAEELSPARVAADPTGAAVAAARESGFQWKGAYDLVSKDVNGARWAMTYDTESGIITGNVFPTDGRPESSPESRIGVPSSRSDPKASISAQPQSIPLLRRTISTRASYCFTTFGWAAKSAGRTAARSAIERRTS